MVQFHPATPLTVRSNKPDCQKPFSSSMSSRTQLHATCVSIDGKGVLRNTGLLDYRMPTCLDMPLIETAIVEVPTPGHPLGIRGVGEVSIVPPPAAVANAIAHAIGVRMTQLPMSPPRLLKAILEKRATNETQAAAAD